MNITAKQFRDKPAEPYRVAEKGETVVINHDRYPTVVFELTARARCCELKKEGEVYSIFKNPVLVNEYGNTESVDLPVSADERRTMIMAVKKLKGKPYLLIDKMRHEKIHYPEDMEGQPVYCEINQVMTSSLLVMIKAKTGLTWYLLNRENFNGFYQIIEDIPQELITKEENDDE